MLALITRIHTLMLLGCFTLLASFNIYAASQSAIVATIDGKNITFEQVNEGIKTQLYDAKMKVFNLQQSQLQNLILQEFVKTNPIGKNMKFEDFMSQYVVKETSVSDAMVDKFIKVNRIPSNKVNAEYRGQVTKYLRSEIIRNQVTKWFDQEAKKHKLTVNLKKPEQPRTQIPIGNAPTLGNKNAKITIVEYSDFQCPYCARAEVTIQSLLKKYGNDIQLVYKQFPLSFHSEAFKASEASLCAKDQSSDFFWKLHNEMFKDRKHLRAGELKEKAGKLGMNKKQFSECLNSDKFANQVNADIAEGNRYGVSSTPMFFVNGIVVKGAKPFAEFEKIILDELSR